MWCPFFLETPLPFQIQTIELKTRDSVMLIQIQNTFNSFAARLMSVIPSWGVFKSFQSSRIQADCYHAEFSIRPRNVFRSTVPWLLLPPIPQLQQHNAASNIVFKSSGASPNCSVCKRQQIITNILSAWGGVHLEHKVTGLSHAD